MPGEDRDRFREVADLLDQVLAHEPGERSAWLESRIADPALRAELAELIRNAEAPEDVLDAPAGKHFALLLGANDEIGRDEPIAGRRVGPYRLEGELGRGGMGVVYLAERADGQFEKRVALKLVRSGFDGEEIVRRFERERRIAARLEHPAIAQIFDGGVTEDGRPYFAMEYVDGEPVTTFCDRERLSIDERLALFVRICEAVQYAHGRLIVHRDLKPSNVLVPANRALKLVDFGIAKVLSEEDADGTDLTHPGGGRPLTPAYAAPEQLAGEPVTAATDVYCLGLLLYELLAGQRPFADKSGNGRALERAILEQDPKPPSRVANGAGEGRSALAAARGLSSAGLARRLAGDLDAIVLRALDRSPARRYPSAQRLGDDVRSHLEHRPVWARRSGRWARAGKFARRHRFGVAAAALLALSIGAGFWGTLWQARQKAAQAGKAERMTEFVLSLFEAADPARALGEEITAKELVDQGIDRLESELAGDPESQAEMGLVLARIQDQLGRSEEAVALLDRSLERAAAAGGPDALRTRAGALRTKGAALVRLGRAAEAEPLLREAIAAHRSLGRSESERALESAEDLDELAIALRALGRLDEAEAAVRESFESRSAHLAQDDPVLGAAHNNLAVIERELGRFEEAEADYRQSLAIREPALGRDHPDTVTTANNLASLMYHRGRYAQAAEEFEEVVASYGRLYGDRHPLSVTGVNNLANVLMRLGELDRSEELFDSVLGFWRESASDQHPNALVTASNLGLLYQLRGDLARALESAKFTVTSAEEVFGPEHPVTAAFRIRLASASRELGRYDEARHQADRALAVLERVYGGTHQHVAAALEEIGRLDLALGESVRAESSLSRALAIRAAQLGDESFEALALQAPLAAALRARGEASEAREVLAAALAAGRSALPDGHPILIELLAESVRAADASGEDPSGPVLAAEALAAAERRYGAASWKCAAIELARAESLAAAGRTGEARALGRSAEGRLEAQLGREHPLARAARRLVEGPS